MKVQVSEGYRGIYGCFDEKLQTVRVKKAGDPPFEVPDKVAEQKIKEGVLVKVGNGPEIAVEIPTEAPVEFPAEPVIAPEEPVIIPEEPEEPEEEKSAPKKTASSRKKKGGKKVPELSAEIPE